MNTEPPETPHMITRVLRAARERHGLSTDQVAELCGVTGRWYRALESGRPRRHSNSLLTTVSRVLDLSEEEYLVLYRLVGTHDLPEKVMAPQTADPVPHRIRTFVQGVEPWGAYLCDYRWDVLAHNDAIVRHFPWISEGVNVMQWALTDPDAPAYLINWETDWALPMIAQLRLHDEQWKHDPRMRAVTQSVLSTAAGRRLWTSPQLPTLSYPAAETTRQLRGPDARRYEVSFVPLMPLQLPWYRFMAVMPV
ncbi:MmyB family transcriptional regulator [Streptomyces zagrosensis]|uniref:Transcriptional regulator with XRE-family HTH domain n=1 Tax=Streptomyces zagrosensis TaxID=1042984 RepID=A0A7W9QEU1_9ACTN|nr:helix-turn-helix domain-containing protein [Streptomyces zagrosensis]MBB5938659.1 transcriptional regulator with XRE-family HTH domain [Streptomyces zagrosensis]